MRLALAVLDVGAVRRGLTRPTGDGTADETDLRRRIAADEGRLDRLTDDFCDDVLDRPTYDRQRDRVSQRLTVNRAALAELLAARPKVIDTGGQSLTDVWRQHEERGDVAWRRELLERVVARVTVRPHPKGTAFTLTRRKSESEEEFAERRAHHRPGGRIVTRQSPYIIDLSAHDQAELQQRARAYTCSHAQVVRAKIVLLAAVGESNTAIASQLDVHVDVVSRWRKRFHKEGLGGLRDRRDHE